jgi:hypothetical protein
MNHFRMPLANGTSVQVRALNMRHGQRSRNCPQTSHPVQGKYFAGTDICDVNTRLDSIYGERIILLAGLIGAGKRRRVDDDG